MLLRQSVTRLSMSVRPHEVCGGCPCDEEAETVQVVEVIAEYGERLRKHLTVIYPDRVEQHLL